MIQRFSKLTEPFLLAALGLAGAAAWIFLGIAEEVVEGDTQAFDGWLLHHLRDPADPSAVIGPGWLSLASRDITALGDMAILILVVLSVAGFLILARRRRLAGFVLASTISGMVLVAILKQVFERNRPGFTTPDFYVATSSFPSGHAMMSALVYLTLATLLARLVADIRLKVYVLCVALAVTLLIGLSRIYLGVHWPSDVAAGWAIGAAWALVWWILAQVFTGPGQTTTDPKPNE